MNVGPPKRPRRRIRREVAKKRRNQQQQQLQGSGCCRGVCNMHNKKLLISFYFLSSAHG
jgi:hypothetical protein